MYIGNRKTKMKQQIAHITVFIVWILCFWSILCVLNTAIFCIAFDMHPSSSDFVLNRFYMVTINKFLTIPAFFIAKYIVK